MYLGQNIKQILPGNVAIGGANMGMVPLFSVMWCPSRAGIWAGYVPADGQEVSQNLYPDAFAGIGAGNVPTTSGANWLSDPMARGAYVEESSPGMFRLPDLNGKSAGSLGATFLRGDGEKSGGVNGLIQQDAFQGHRHAAEVANFINNGSLNAAAGTALAGGNNVTPTTGTPVIDGVNGTPRTASETRPLNITGCWVIKLFGAVTNVGSADVAQLASDYASLKARPIGLGDGQTWQDMTGSRAAGVTYLNTTGRPIYLSVGVITTGIGQGTNLLVDGGPVAVLNNNNSQAVLGALQTVVPDGSSYRVQLTGGATLYSFWKELR